MITPFYNGKYRFRFVGIDALTPKDEQDMDIKALTNYEMLDEVRVRRGLAALGEEKGGNLILNPNYMQFINQKTMMENGMQSGGMGDQGGQFDGGEGQGASEEEENPFDKAFEHYFQKLNI